MSENVLESQAHVLQELAEVFIEAGARSGDELAVIAGRAITYRDFLLKLDGAIDTFLGPENAQTVGPWQGDLPADDLYQQLLDAELPEHLAEAVVYGFHGSNGSNVVGDYDLWIRYQNSKILIGEALDNAFGAGSFNVDGEFVADYFEFAQSAFSNVSVQNTDESARILVRSIANFLEDNGITDVQVLFDPNGTDVKTAVATLAVFVSLDDPDATIGSVNSSLVEALFSQTFEGMLASDGFGNPIEEFIRLGLAPLLPENNKCFIAGTQICLWSGRSVPIEELNVGDIGVTFDINTGQMVPGRISKLFSNTTSEFIVLQFEDDREDLVATPGHRFLTETGDYIEIGHMLRLGGGTVRLVDQSGEIVEAQGELITYSAETAHMFPESASKSIAFEGNAVLKEDAAQGWTTYNFEVAEHHNYVAGGIRVHNDSALSVITPEEWANATDLRVIETETVGGVERVVDAVLRVENGHIVTDTRISQSDGSSSIVDVETVIKDEDSRILHLTREVHNLVTGDIETIVSRPVYGQMAGQAIGESLTPFLTQAIVGQNGSAFETIAADTFLGTTLETFASIIGAQIDLGLSLELTGNGELNDAFETAATQVFEDFGENLVINGVESSIGIVNQLIMSEIFGESSVGGVGDAVLQGLAGATINSVLTSGAVQLLDAPFFENIFGGFGLETDVILNGLAPGNVDVILGGTQDLATNLGFDPISVIITATLNEVLPDIETQEGAIAASVTQAILGLFTSSGLVPLQLAGLVVGKIFDSLFEKHPQAWSKVGFNAETGQFEITGTWVDDGGDAQLSQDLAQAYVDAMNEFVDAVMSNSNNFDELGQWSFGHYESALKNAGATGKTFAEFQDAYLYSYVEDLTHAEVTDGQRVAVRAVENINVAQLRIDHRLKLLLEALDDVDVVIDLDSQTTLVPGGEGDTTTTYAPVFAQNLREKVEYLANDGGGVTIYPGTTGGEDQTPAVIAHPLDDVALVTENIPGGEGDTKTYWKVTKQQLELDLQFALEQLTQSQTLLDLLETYDFDTLQELESLGGVPQQTFDDEGIYTKIASTLQIATDYHNYMENQEEIDALMVSAPTSALAAGWLQTIHYAELLGLTDPYVEIGDAIGNNFFTAEGNDFIRSAGGHDDVRTYSGNDTIHGGSGNDTLDAGSGDNTIRGNTGDDVFVVSSPSGTTRIVEQAGEGQDTLLFDARFSNVDVYFDESANGFVADWNDGSIEAIGVESVAFRFAPDTSGDNGTIKVAINDIHQDTSGTTMLEGSNRSDYLELSALESGQGGHRIYRGKQGDDLFIYRKDMGDVAILGEWAASGDNDRLVLRDLVYSDVTMSIRSTANHDFLDLYWNDGADSGTISIGDFGQHIEAIQFADGYVLNKVLIETDGAPNLNNATGHDILTNDSDLRAFLELLNDQSVLVGKTEAVTTTYGGEDSTTTTTITPTYAANFREKVEFFAQDGSSTVIVEGTSGGEDNTPPIVADPFDEVTLVTKFVPGGEGATTSFWQVTPFNMSTALTTLVAKMTKSKQLLDILAQDDFLSFEQFLDATFNPVIPDEGQGIYGSSGHDSIVVHGARNTIVSNGGSDTITSQSGIDSIDSGHGNDLIFAGNFYDTILSGDGDDTVEGGPGRDEIWLSGGADVFRDNSQNNQHGHDLVYGGAGNDRLLGDGGQDTLSGGDHNDLIVGGLNDDSLIGGSGDDTLSGSAGGDVLDGGDGIDRAAYDSSGVGVIVNLSNPGENTGEAAGDTFISIENLLGSEFGDVLTGDSGANVLWGNDGNDTLLGGTREDLIYGGNGDDEIHGGSHYDTIHAGAGDDIVWGDNGRDVIHLDDGNDIFHDNGQSTSNGHDSVNGGNGEDTLNGGGGNDTLIGGAHDDFIYGGAGNDMLEGGIADDFMKGGTGADIFVFRGNFGEDVVSDFNPAQSGEKIDFELVSSINSFADLSTNHLSQSGSNAIIDDGAGNTITLVDVNMNNLAEDNFVF